MCQGAGVEVADGMIIPGGTASLRMERYTVVARFEVSANCVIDESIDGVPLQISVAMGAMTAAVSRGDSTRCSVELRWGFDELYTEDSKQDFPAESRIEMCRRLGVLYIPSEGGGFESDRRVVGECLLDMARPYFARLALTSRCPDFWNGFCNVVLDGRCSAEVFAEVDGGRIDLKPQRYWGGPDIKRSPVALEQAKRFGAAIFPKYASFLLAADWHFLQGVCADAIVHLAQALEIAAYEYVRKPEIGLPADWHFNAPECFGAKKHKKIRAYDSSFPITYPAICELVGARHEWIHEGQAKVRIFSPEKGDADKSKLRNLVRQDFYIFRSAVSLALQWMGELPIE